MKSAFAGKGFTSMTQYNLVHKCFPMTQAMNIPDAEAAMDKEGKSSRQFPAWDFGKVKSKKHKRDKKKVHFASLMDTCHLKKCGVRTNRSIKAEWCSGRTL